MAERFRHRLKGNNSEAIPNRWIFYDCESRIVEKDDGVVELPFKFLTARYWQRADGKAAERIEDYVFEDREKFGDLLESKAKMNRHVWVVAFNMNADFIFANIRPMMTKRGWHCDLPYVKGRVKMSNIRKPSPKYAVFLEIAKPELKDNGLRGKKRIKVGTLVDEDGAKFTGRKWSAYLEFVDLANYYLGSLADIGEAVGLPKLDIDLVNAPMSEMIPYCARDTQIVYLAMRARLEAWARAGGGKWRKTNSSLSMSLFRHKYLKTPIYIDKDQGIEDLEYRSYRGGRCEVLAKGTFIKGPYYSLDINAAYAHKMQENDYPRNRVGQTAQGSIGELRHLLRHYCVTADVTLRARQAAYPHVVNKRTAYPLGDFETTLTTRELELALKHDELLDVGMMVWYEKAPIFRKFIDDIMGHEIACKSEIKRLKEIESARVWTSDERAAYYLNVSDRQFWKDMRNHNYGKWAQRDTKRVYWGRFTYDWEKKDYNTVDESPPREKPDTGERALARGELMARKEALGTFDIVPPRIVAKYWSFAHGRFMKTRNKQGVLVDHAYAVMDEDAASLGFDSQQGLEAAILETLKQKALRADLDAQIKALSPDTSHLVDYRMVYFGDEGWGYRQGGAATESFPAISAHITADVRLYLWSLLNHAGLDNVFYTDTDSAWVNQLGYDNLTPWLDPMRLGALKVEKQGETLEIKAKKWYVYDDHITCKGATKRGAWLDDHTHRQQHWPSLLTSLTSECPDLVRVKTVQKVFTGDIFSGIVTESGRVRPFVLPYDVEGDLTVGQVIGRGLKERAHLIESLHVNIPVIAKCWDVDRKTVTAKHRKKGETHPLGRVALGPVAEALGFIDWRECYNRIVREGPRLGQLQKLGAYAIRLVAMIDPNATSAFEDLLDKQAATLQGLTLPPSLHEIDLPQRTALTASRAQLYEELALVYEGPKFQVPMSSLVNADTWRIMNMAT